MKYLLGFLISINLIACGGGGAKLDPSPLLGFTQEELVNTLFISKSVLSVDINRAIPLNASETEGQITIFNSGMLREFPLTRENHTGFADGYADFLDSPWTALSNGQFQVDYDQFGICTTKKERETTTEIDISGECPRLSNLFDTVLVPLEFDSSFLQGKTIATQDEGSEQTFEFLNDGTFELTTDIFGELLLKSGTFLNSEYKNVVKINLPHNVGLTTIEGTVYRYDYSLLFLVAGNLSNGKLVEIRYFSGDILDDIRIHSVTTNGSWLTNNRYINWSIRGF